MSGDYLWVNGHHFQVGSDHREVSGDHFKMGIDHFGVNGDHFEVDSDHFSHARILIVCQSWTAVWASTQRWSMSTDILDWPKYRRDHGQNRASR